MTVAVGGVLPADRRILWASVVLGALVSAAVCYAVATQSLVVGSVVGGWYYAYGQPFSLRILFVALLVSAVAGALLLVATTTTGREWPRLLAWLLVAAGVDWVLRSLAPFTLEALLVSDSANSFYGVTQHYAPSDVLDRFSRFRSQVPLHAQSNMPGKLMLLYALQLVSARPGVLAWLIVLVSNLGAVLMYVFVRDLFQDRKTALFSAVLYLFVPSRAFFFPLMNTVTPVIVLGCACVLMRWLRTGRTAYAALMGAGLYLLTFFEPLPLVMGLLFAGLVLGATARAEISWSRVIPQAALMAFTFIAISEAITWWFGFELVHAFRQIGEHAAAFNAAAARPYRVWIGANLREFVVGTGAGQVAALGGALVYGLRTAPSWRERLTRPITVVCLGLVAVLLTIDLIGVNRGEVIRLWIFLACFWQIPAAYVCSTLESRTAMLLVLCPALVQTTLAMAMIRFVVP